MSLLSEESLAVGSVIKNETIKVKVPAGVDNGTVIRLRGYGGGDISVTPGVECLNLAISDVTLKPGNCPPSPGLAPWAILISISLQLFK